jgi:hypothetical protein
MKPKHAFRFLGFAATGAGILTGSLLLFQKEIGGEVFTANVTLKIATITLLLAGAQILFVGFASEILSPTYCESLRKAIAVSRRTTAPDELRFSREVTEEIHADNGNNFEHHASPSLLQAQSRPERPTLMVSAHQPRLVRKIGRNRLA